ncbi:MAG: hypothetical protein HOC82_00140 [Bacteroidetes bacterium]|nr:hypothetical protein [Bacteroidota bacterium]
MKKAGLPRRGSQWKILMILGIISTGIPMTLSFLNGPGKYPGNHHQKKMVIWPSF